MNPKSAETVVNDVHSRLNETAVDEIVRVTSLESIQAAIAQAGARGKPVAVCGGRHSMGGQQFCLGGVLLDTRGLSRVVALDGHRGTIEVEAGCNGPVCSERSKRAR